AEGEEGGGVVLDVVEGADHAGGGEEGGEQLLAGGERERREIAVADREDVEGDEGDGDLLRGEAHLVRLVEVDALGEEVEAGAAVGALGDDLAVEHDARGGEGLGGAGDVGVRRGPLAELAADDADAALVLLDEGADAVELQLVEPLGAGG